jgi:hypothetical protein
MLLVALVVFVRQTNRRGYSHSRPSPHQERVYLLSSLLSDQLAAVRDVRHEPVRRFHHHVAAAIYYKRCDLWPGKRDFDEIRYEHCLAYATWMDCDGTFNCSDRGCPKHCWNRDATRPVTTTN